MLLVLAVMLASHLKLRSQTYARDMSVSALQAMRLTAIAAMEDGEYAVLERQATRDGHTAEQYAQGAKYLAYRATNVDTVYAERSRRSGHYFESIAALEQQETDGMVRKVQRDDATRVQLVANLTADEELEAALEQQERDVKVHSSLCDVGRFFEAICAILGSAPGLVQLQEVEEQQRIVQESQALSKIEKLEFMEELVASILQGKTDQYNQTATDLLHVAVLWDAQAHQDEQAAIQDSETALVFAAEEERVKALMQREKSWKKENTSAAEDLLREAEHLGRAAHRYAVEAALLAIFALLFFVPTVYHRFASLADSARQADARDEQERLWTVSYWMQHVFIFLLVIGMMDSDYLLHLDEYDVPKRAVIVVWFAYLAAGLQTILLHTIPHCMAEYPIDRDTVGDIAVQFFLNLFALMAFFIMELLLVWLTVRDVVLTEQNVQTLSTWGFYFYFLLMLTTHLVVFEPRGVSSGIRVDEQSTVLMSEDDDDNDDDSLAVTETSPLRGEASSSSPTEDMPIIFFLNSRHPRSIGGSSARTSSPYTMNTNWEFAKLTAVFEVLLIVCAICVLRNGMALTWTHFAARTAAFFGMFAVLFSICALTLFLLRFKRTRHQGDWLAASPPAKMLTYNTIDV